MTYLIFDWDDTLFPTSYYSQYNLNKYEIVLLDNSIYELLKKLIIKYTIYIISNASLIWIHESINLLPLTKSFIYEHCTIISAQDNYGTDPDIYHWKYYSFENIIKDTGFYLSIGDGDCEKQASFSFGIYSLTISPANTIENLIKIHSSLLSIIIYLTDKLEIETEYFLDFK